MMYLTLTVLFFITINFVSTHSFCQKGCKCKAFDYCYACETGYYEQDGKCKNCSTNCLSCSSENKCEKCENGYFNYKFNHLNNSCHPCSTGCTECTSETNCLQCDSGYFKNGNKCEKCLPECKTCKSEHYCNTCNDGFKLNGTSCQKCPEGYFKSDFSCLPCPESCASCSIITECTSCKDGFFGKTCEQRCSRGCDGNVCELNTGKCTCKENYVEPYCYLCKPQKYGVDCNIDCPKGCLPCHLNESCTVVCNNGHVSRCYCPDGCLDNTCDIITGRCLQCKPFFKLPCVECIHGKWGNNCTKDCPVGCLSCLSDTNCTKCKDGFYDSDGKCLKCPKNCLNALCNEYNGSCNDGCRRGYWGINCDKLCPKNCLNGTCDEGNGICRLGCKDNYYGDICECPNNCICNSTGQCFLSCLNFLGDDKLCDIEINRVCLKCSNGRCEHCGNYTFYGLFCDKECCNTCIDGRCDSLSGRCASGCKVGFFGNTCSKACRGNCYKLPCNRETGICDVDETGRDHYLLNVADVNVIMMTCVAVLVTYAIVTTFILIRKRNIRRHQLNANVSTGENAANNYQPTVHVYRIAAGSDHMYAVPDVTSSGSVPLVSMETRDRSNSTEERDMYIHPVYAESTVRHEYEEIK